MKAKEPSLPYYLLITRRKKDSSFLKGICAKWNLSILNLDLNLTRQVHFQLQ